MADSNTARLSITEFKPGRLRETEVQLVDTVELVARAVYAQAHLAATITVESRGATLHADVPASAVAAAFTVVAAVGMAAAVAVDRAGVYNPGLKNLRREWMLCGQRS